VSLLGDRGSEQDEVVATGAQNIVRIMTGRHTRQLSGHCPGSNSSAPARRVSCGARRVSGRVWCGTRGRHARHAPRAMRGRRGRRGDTDCELDSSQHQSLSIPSLPGADGAATLGSGCVVSGVPGVSQTATPDTKQTGRRESRSAPGRQ
jgi:hypothetical protein